MLNFLGNFCENKYKYSIINSHRSVISAYYNLAEGKPVGQHISVCKLMTGVFNKNPPKPKYIFVWDVEKVLKYIKTLSTNTEFSERTLLLKLHFCRQVPRDLLFGYTLYGEDFSIIRISFFKVNKELEKGKAPPCLELRAYPQDRNSCVMACLEVYLKRPNSWREKGQTQLLLSHLKPYKEIQKSILAGWVKSFLEKQV